LNFGGLPKPPKDEPGLQSQGSHGPENLDVAPFLAEQAIATQQHEYPDAIKPWQ
jgi:hypothetical protein